MSKKESNKDLPFFLHEGEEVKEDPTQTLYLRWTLPYLLPEIKKKVSQRKGTESIHDILDTIIEYYHAQAKNPMYVEPAYYKFKSLVDQHRFSAKFHLFTSLRESKDPQEISHLAGKYVMRNLQRMTSLLSGFLGNMRMLTDCSFQKLKFLYEENYKKGEVQECQLILRYIRVVFGYLSLVDIINPGFGSRVRSLGLFSFPDEQNFDSQILFAEETYLQPYFDYLQGPGKELLSQTTDFLPSDYAAVRHPEKEEQLIVAAGERFLQISEKQLAAQPPISSPASTVSESFVSVSPPPTEAISQEEYYLAPEGVSSIFKSSQTHSKVASSWQIPSSEEISEEVRIILKGLPGMKKRSPPELEEVQNHLMKMFRKEKEAQALLKAENEQLQEKLRTQSVELAREMSAQQTEERELLQEAQTQVQSVLEQQKGLEGRLADLQRQNESLEKELTSYRNQETSFKNYMGSVISGSLGSLLPIFKKTVPSASEDPLSTAKTIIETLKNLVNDQETKLVSQTAAHEKTKGYEHELQEVRHQLEQKEEGTRQIQSQLDAALSKQKELSQALIQEKKNLTTQRQEFQNEHEIKQGEWHALLKKAHEDQTRLTEELARIKDQNSRLTEQVVLLENSLQHKSEELQSATNFLEEVSAELRKTASKEEGTKEIEKLLETNLAEIQKQLAEAYERTLRPRENQLAALIKEVQAYLLAEEEKTPREREIPLLLVLLMGSLGAVAEKKVYSTQQPFKEASSGAPEEFSYPATWSTLIDQGLKAFQTLFEQKIEILEVQFQRDLFLNLAKDLLQRSNEIYGSQAQKVIGSDTQQWKLLEDRYSKFQTEIRQSMQQVQGELETLANKAQELEEMQKKEIDHWQNSYSKLLMAYAEKEKNLARAKEQLLEKANLEELLENLKSKNQSLEQRLEETGAALNRYVMEGILDRTLSSEEPQNTAELIEDINKLLGESFSSTKEKGEA